MSKFVKEVVTHKVVRVIDGSGPCGVYMSVVPYGDTLSLVIGAMWEDACASSLSKSGLAELIEELKLIHGAM